jgi:beta-barrel assembly-enhancing protease
MLLFFNMRVLLVAIALFFSLNSSLANVTVPPGEEDIVAQEHLATVYRIFKSFLVVIGKDFEDYTLEVHKDDVLNAYATLGKKIVINTGLIENTDSEASLAFVVAHELGHVERKHVIKGMSRSGLSLLLRIFVTKNNALLNGIDQVQSLQFSRSKERQADYFAIDLINKTYCTVSGKLEFFEKIADERQVSKVNEYFSTHPLPQSRINYLRKEIQEAGCVI